MSNQYGETLYDLANEIFDDVVLTYQDRFDEYNARPELADELYAIVDCMCDEAISAMYSTANHYKEDFISRLEEL